MVVDHHQKFWIQALAIAVCCNKIINNFKFSHIHFYFCWVVVVGMCDRGKGSGRPPLEVTNTDLPASWQDDVNYCIILNRM